MAPTSSRIPSLGAAAKASALLALLAVAALPRASEGATYMLPMRDGVKLNTDVDEPPFESKKVPAVLERSPYGADAEELIALVFAELLGYVGVRQDMRGTQKSEGNFTLWHDSASDAHDTMDWIVQQPWSNGVVFTTGASADGIDEVAQISNPHPALRGQTAIFDTALGYQTFYIGGAYREALIDGWLHGTVPGQFTYLDEFVKTQEQPGTPWWGVLNGTNFWGNVTWPAVHWAGWFDIFQQPNLETFNGFQYSGGPGGRANQKLVIDPLGHCQAGASFFTHDTAFGRVLLPILMALDFMKDDSVTNKTFPSPPEGVKNITMYVMGAEEPGAPGQYWTTLPDWPAYTPTDYYLGPGGSLSTAPPPPAGPATKATYTYDPADPVPTIGGNNLLIPCGPLDQRPIEESGRQDVLVFTSDVLASTVTVTGTLTAKIFMSTNVKDTDIVVKLIDVYPADSVDTKLANSSTLLADGITRMKWRLFPQAGNEPQLLSGDPADVYEARVDLWNTSYSFAPGHRIRVHVSSSNHPRFFPNRNDGLYIADPKGKNTTATTTILFDAAHPSRIVLPVVDAATQLPPFPVEEKVDASFGPFEAGWRERRAAARAAGLLREPRDDGEEEPASMLEWLRGRVAKAMTAAAARPVAPRRPRDGM